MIAWHQAFMHGELGIVGVRDGLGQKSPRLSLLSRLEFEDGIWDGDCCSENPRVPLEM